MSYEVYGKEGCTYCVKAKMLLELKEVDYKYIDIMEDDEAMDLFIDAGFKTVPQIYEVSGDCHSAYIGGYDALVGHLLSNKKLDDSEEVL